MRITCSDKRWGDVITTDTGTANVLITDAFVGPTLVSDDGEEISISMRDTGFELTYLDGDSDEHVYTFKNGKVTLLSIGPEGKRARNVVPIR